MRYTLPEVEAMIERYPGLRYQQGFTSETALRAFRHCAVDGTVNEPDLRLILGQANLDTLKRLKTIPGYPN